MSAPSCSTCGTTMESSSSIGTNGYYCPNPSCTDATGPTFQLNYSPGGARHLRSLTVCWFEILSATCKRCGLRYNARDEGDRMYHENSGGCR